MPKLNKNREEKQQEEKKKGLLLFLLMFILLVLMVLIVYLLFFYDFSGEKEKVSPKTGEQQEEQLSESSDGQQDTEEESSENTFEITPPEEEEGFNDRADFTETDLKKLASSFTERLGSYSNQSQYDNLKDLKIFMSEDMNKWAENYIAEQLDKEYSQSYYGISTKAVTAEVKEFDKDAGQARVLVQTQRVESREGEEDEIFYQDINLALIKQNASWKVDEANWE